MVKWIHFAIQYIVTEKLYAVFPVWGIRSLFYVLRIQSQPVSYHITLTNVAISLRRPPETASPAVRKCYLAAWEVRGQSPADLRCGGSCFVGPDLFCENRNTIIWAPAGGWATVMPREPHSRKKYSKHWLVGRDRCLRFHLANWIFPCPRELGNNYVSCLKEFLFHYILWSNRSPSVLTGNSFLLKKRENLAWVSM